MIPIVTPEEMAEVDAAAPEPIDVLIERAGAAVAWSVRKWLGGTYGQRIALIAGKGNNGEDGRVAAGHLRRWGARVVELDPSVERVPEGCDLVIDAAYGTGLSGPYVAPSCDAPVLAVDIASGVNGLTGEIEGRALSAEATVTFQALKPGHLLHPGAGHSGAVEIVDLGLDVSAARAGLLQADDVATMLPSRGAQAHKWESACLVVAGSPGMTGAAHLAAAAAARAGAGYVRLSVPGSDDALSGAASHAPVEVVQRPFPAEGWATHFDDASRFDSLVIGPGLGRDAVTLANVRDSFGVSLPLVIDGDALGVVSDCFDVLRARRTPAVLTPHDGEFEAITGSRPSADRIASARRLATECGSVVLLKGPATIVAAPTGDVVVSATGDQRLATAGTGDVLAGTIGALLARGLEPLEAAAAGAWLHGKAATLAPRHGMVASDLLIALPEVLDETDVG